MKQWHASRRIWKNTTVTTECGRLLPLDHHDKHRTIDELTFETMCPLCKKRVVKKGYESASKWFKES
jgi:hypothetical protein